MSIFTQLKLLFGGYDSEGYNRHGFDRKGYDRDGYNRRGFNKKHRHRDTGTRFDLDGYDYDGFDADGEHMEYAHLKGCRAHIIQEGIVQVDLHGMSVRGAGNLLEALLDGECDGQLAPDVYRLVLIHGFNSGSRLKSMVRCLDHPRIGEIKIDLYNEGMTIYEVK